jgi:hypothetical protein
MDLTCALQRWSWKQPHLIPIGPIFQPVIKLTVIYYSLNFNIIENVKSSFNTSLNGGFHEDLRERESLAALS